MVPPLQGFVYLPEAITGMIFAIVLVVEGYIGDSIMSGTTYNGLCSTCKHASTCTFPVNPRRPSFFCEEFEIEMVTPAKMPIDDTSRLTDSYIAEVEGLSESIGLCGDCENNRTCTLQKSEGGVWHCEEYK